MDLQTLARRYGLEAVLEFQDRLIRRDQAIAAGLAPVRVDDLLRRTRWTRVLPAVYLAGAQPLQLDQRIRAGWLWGGADSVIAGAAASHWNGWRRREPIDVVDVIVDPGRRLSVQPGYRVLRCFVPDRDWRWVRDVRVTTTARTCLDLARTRRDPDAEQALRRRLVTVPQLEGALRRGAYLRGQRAARALVAELVSGPWSRGETKAHRHLRDAGVSGWVANLRVVHDDVVQFIDIAFEDVKLAVEIDGFDVHGDPAALARDLARQNRLVQAGWTVLRFTWHDLDDPTRFVAAVLRALQRLRAANA
jgi:very-short-patch-repair endonuclease